MQIQKRRLQHGWSQEQLAELTGLSVRTIQRIENGQTRSMESTKALGAVFGINFLDQSPEKEAKMNTTTPEAPNADEILAFTHVKKLRGFYFHACQYIVIISFLAVANLMTEKHYLWFLWPMFGWGLGLLFHALKIFNKIPFLNAAWEKREVEKYIGRKL